jgi:hypothetical protein
MRNVIGASLIAVALIAVPGAQAQNCTNSQFKGVYSALARGEFLAGLPAPLLGPTTRIGRVEVDGQGHSSIRAITSLNGLELSEVYTGMYSTNPDCTGSVTLNIPFPGFPDPLPFTFNAVLSDNFQQLDMILVNPPGSTVVISLRQQNKANCSANDLNGGYVVNMAGVDGAVPFARLGRVVFDGTGSFSAGTTVSKGGEILTETLDGMYTVASSCELTMSYILPAEVVNTWSGVLMNNSAGANVMVTGPTVPAGDFAFLGNVLAGTLVKQ